MFFFFSNCFISESDLYNTYFIPNNTNPYALTGSNTSLFKHSDFNITLNNVSSSTLSIIRRKTEKQSYSSGSILSLCEIQDSNYYDSSWSNARYKGNKLSGIRYNIFTSGDISYDNNPVIRHLDSCIYEVEWGGGGYPENENGGGIRIGNIYVVGETKNDIVKLTTEDPAYYNILEKNMPQLSTAILNQYSGTPVFPSNITISYAALGLPSATYYVASNYSSSSGPYGTLYPTGSVNVPNSQSYIAFNNVQSTFTHATEINSDGFLQQSSTTIENDYLLSSISASLVAGDRWFVSFYSGSGTSTLITGLPTASYGSLLSQYGYPFEIERYYTPAPGEDYLLIKGGPNNSTRYWFETGSSYKSGVPVLIGAYSGQCYTGMMLIKAEYPSNGLTLFGYPSYNFSSISKGYIVLPYKKDVITDNIKYIVEKHIINPT